MLTVNGRNYTQADFQAVTKPVIVFMAATAPAEGSVKRGVLSSLIALATQSAAAFDVGEVVDVYGRLVDDAVAQVPLTAAARTWCRTQLRNPVAAQLSALAVQQSQDLAGLQAQGTVVITRGTDPLQARDILTHGTFGGSVPDPALVAAPTSADADRQTGVGQKNTAVGRIEEWSLGALMGFASNGFLLVAEANVAVVTLPKSDFAVRAGEAGVCGYAAASLVRVAILDEGRQTADEPLQLELEKTKKALGTGRIDGIALLKAAALRLRGVVL